MTDPNGLKATSVSDNILLIGKIDIFIVFIRISITPHLRYGNKVFYAIVRSCILSYFHRYSRRTVIRTICNDQVLQNQVDII